MAKADHDGGHVPTSAKRTQPWQLAIQHKPAETDAPEAGDTYAHPVDAMAGRVVQRKGKSSAHLLDGFVGGAAALKGMQRMIVIAAAAYDPAPDLLAVEYKYGKDMVEALATMHNGGEPPVYAYATKDQLMIELNLRDKAIEVMAKANANADNLRYATRRGDPAGGWLDPEYWDKVGFYQFLLTLGAKPAPSERSIFESKDNVLECNSAMVAVEYGSMLETMGKVAFNKRMADDSLIISPYHLPPRGVDRHPLFEEGMIDTVAITSAKHLIPGDWVYFRNIAGYLTKHPNGFWSGEHALYLGDGKFQGFGTPVLTEGEMEKKLLDSYNAGLPISQRKQIEDVPGRQNYAHRPVVENIVR